MELSKRHGVRPEVPLGAVALEVPKQSGLRQSLNSFCHDTQSEVPSESGRCTDDRGIAAVGAYARNEALVHFQFVNWDRSEERECRVASSEIIQGSSDVRTTNTLKVKSGCGDVGQHCRFGQLDADAGRITASSAQFIHEIGERVCRRELAR